MKSPQSVRILCACFLAGALAILVLLSGCGTKNPALTSAKIYMGLTPPDYDRAAEQLLLAVQKDSLSGEAHLLLGEIYAHQQMYSEMLAQFDRAETCKLTPEQVEEIKRMRTQAWTQVLNSGIDLARQSRQVDGYRLGLLADFSAYPQYRDTLQTMSREVPDGEKLTWNRYQTYGEAKPALEQLERALDQQAFDRYQLAIRIDSTRYEPYVNLAADYVNKDELDKALVNYAKAYLLKPDDSNVMNDYAVTLLRAGEFDEALGLYDRILQSDPANVNALVNLAMIYARKGETGKAQETYSKIVSIDPEYSDAYFNRGLLYMGQSQEKILLLRAYQDSLEADKKNKELASRYQSAWEDYDRLFLKAEADFRNTAEIDTNDKDAYFHLGLLYVSRAQIQTEKDKQNADFGRAETLFQRGLKVDPEDFESLKYLGFTLIRLRKWQEATIPLEKLVELDPTDREAWGYLAIAYANLNKKDLAEQARKKSAR
jgi:tetratricopeptide (TPR) repeat protein